ncbi:MAG: hypothetical protein AB1806_06370 [Acidobacteriota bacterium]
MTPKAADLLEQGAARSATVRRLVETLARSNVVVYVETAPLKVPGRLRILSASRTCRFVWITVNESDATSRSIPALGHELQHAVEIAGAPEVICVKSLQRYYERNGYQDYEGVYCTRAAAQVTSRVQYEVMESGAIRAGKGRR